MDKATNNFYCHSAYMEYSNINKNTILNDGIKQYLIINHKQTILLKGLRRYCLLRGYITLLLLLYFNYDKYFKDNFNQIINKYKNMFNMIDDLKTANITFNFIKNNNVINQFVKYKKID